MKHKIKIHPDHTKELAKKHNCSENTVRWSLNGFSGSDLAIKIRESAADLQKIESDKIKAEQKTS